MYIYISIDNRRHYVMLVWHIVAHISDVSSCTVDVFMSECRVQSRMNTGSAGYAVNDSSRSTAVRAIFVNLQWITEAFFHQQTGVALPMKFGYNIFSVSHTCLSETF